MKTGHRLHDEGLAIAFYHLNEEFMMFRYGAETILIKSPNIDHSKPNRCIEIFRQDGYFVARIEDVRKAQALQHG